MPKRYSERALIPSDWSRLSRLRCHALRLKPNDYWLTLAQQLLYTRKQWQNICTPRGNECGFGRFDYDKMIGMALLLEQNRNRPWHPGKSVLGQVYTGDPHDPKREQITHELLDEVFKRARERGIKAITTAVRIDNPREREIMYKYGFRRFWDEDVIWPATKKRVRQNWMVCKV